MSTSLLKRQKVAIAALALVPVMLLGGCASGTSSSTDSASTTVTGGDPLPIDQLCGDKPIKIAHVAGFGGNTWRQITEAELVDELSACSNVTVEYAQADGDLQKYIGLINTYSAQGFDAIVTYDDFGDQALSALTSAFEAGTVVIPYIGVPSGGKVGVNYNGQVAYDFAAEGVTMAQWMSKLAPKGSTVIFTGGLETGSTSTQALYEGASGENKKLGDPFVLAGGAPIASGWDPAYMQQAMPGILAKYPDFKGWMSDYGAADLGGLRAMVAAGVKIPALATSATNNELGCFWLEQREANPDFQLLTLDESTTVVRIAGRKALAAVNKLSDNEPELFSLPVFVDTVNGKLPTCNKDLPGDADLSSGLSEDQLKKLFK